MRNIYINAHFYDARRAEGVPTYGDLIAEDPLRYLESYVLDNLPKWGAGKRRDFVPKLLTDAGREMAVRRLDHLDAFFASLRQELTTHMGNGHYDRLSVLLHFMTHRDDPSIADEVGHLARAWDGPDVPQTTRQMIERLHDEMIGRK